MAVSQPSLQQFLTYPSLRNQQNFPSGASYKSCEIITEIEYKIYMTQINSSHFAARRALKLSSLRDSLKTFDVMKKRSSELQELLSRKNQLIKRSDKNNDLSDISDTPSIENLDLQGVETHEFFDSYELKEKIGQGCNATVYRCIYKPTGKNYAVKKMRIEQQHVPALKRDFITLREINHPAICHYKAFYIKIEQRTAFLVMEYLPLANISNYCPESENELRSIVRQLLDALDYLHSRNICHRDIKPENILFDKKTKKVKLIDFGISKKTFLRGQRREMLTIIGTHYYMAPQIFLGGGYDEIVDLWALGVSIFKIVTGYTPFESKYYSDIIKNIQAGIVHYDYSVWGNYSFNLRNFVQSLLKPVGSRMTLKEAQNHLWLMQGQKKKKLLSLSSHSHVLHENFHNQSMKLRQAASKEQGSASEDKRLFRSIKILENDIFELEESDDDEYVVTPTTSNSLRMYSLTPQPQKHQDTTWSSEKFTDII